jgi:hypothetical protein
MIRVLRAMLLVIAGGPIGRSPHWSARLAIRMTEVRNNATRALSVLVRSDPKLVSDIDPATFTEMLNSGAWSDRNKAASLPAQLTADGN